MFDKNVRYQLNGGKSEVKYLQDQFRFQIYNGFIKSLQSDKHLSATDKETITASVQKDFSIGLSQNGQPLFDSSGDLFWFHHNGITVYVETDSTDILNNNPPSHNYSNGKISLPSDRTHVINGAQTLSNCFKYFNLLKNSCTKVCSDNTIDLDNTLKIIDSCFESFIVKTIIVYGDSQLRNSITLGLNTQIPITNYDIVDSKYLDLVNLIFDKYNVRVVKSGESYFGNSFEVRDFLKAIRVLNDAPGHARSFNKVNVSDDLKSFINSIYEEISNHIEKDSDDKRIIILVKNIMDNHNYDTDSFDALSEQIFSGESIPYVQTLINKLLTINEVDKWWKSRFITDSTGAVIDISKEDVFYGLHRNGNTYFKSYIITTHIKSLETRFLNVDDFNGKYSDFLDEFIFLNGGNAIESNDLKSDKLFEVYVLNTLPIDDQMKLSSAPTAN